MDVQMGLLLRWGVIVACAVMIAGGALYLRRHGAEFPHYSRFRGEPAEYRTLSGIFASVRGERGRGIIQLSCLLMILTPVLRVIFAVYAFGRQRDWLYATVSSIVLAILIYANT